MLDIDFTFLFALINFAILYFFVKKFLFSKLGAFMDKRSEDIAQDIEKGKALVAAGDEYLKQHEEMLAGTEKECRDMLELARNEAEARGRDIIRQAKIESSRLLQEAKEEAQREYTKIEQGSRTRIAALAISAASKIIEQNMDTARNQELVQQFLDKEASR